MIIKNWWEITLFEDNEIRRERYNDERWFNIVDVVNILTENTGKDKWAYRRKLKQRLSEESNEVVTKCHELKFMATDGKKYKSDAANTEIMLRINNIRSSYFVRALKTKTDFTWDSSLILIVIRLRITGIAYKLNRRCL